MKFLLSWLYRLEERMSGLVPVVPALADFIEEEAKLYDLRPARPLSWGETPLMGEK